MRERRCFVQFIHPGGEHRPDQGDLKFWNRDAHRRKFLKSRGRYIDGGEVKEGEIVFWGEWEPESRIIARYTDRVPDGPHFLHEPFFVDHHDGAWRQNTDPFVFGECFHYTGCLQHTRHGPTQLGFLAPGSLVLFGSCRERSRFVVDTVFVVRDYVDHRARDWKETIEGRISNTYRKVTLEPWYLGSVPEGQSHRLYAGATPDEPIGEMFSFFPCRPYDEKDRGFARPEVHISGFITRHLTQGKKMARDLSLAEVGERRSSVRSNHRDWRSGRTRSFRRRAGKEVGVSKILHPSGGAEDWQRFLAEPEKQWRTGYSAKALANCWEAADGFPPSVQALFDGSRFEELHGLEMLLGIPEHRVPLPGGRRASQTDLFVLARANDGLAAIAVEGKVAEPFGPLVREWIAATPSSVEGEPDIPPSEGKRERLAFLSSNLGLSVTDVADVRYQLVHDGLRAIEARRFAARYAVMLVHSFGERDQSFADYERFAAMLSAHAKRDELVAARVPGGASLYLGWATGDRAYLVL